MKISGLTFTEFSHRKDVSSFTLRTHKGDNKHASAAWLRLQEIDLIEMLGYLETIRECSKRDCEKYFSSQLAQCYMGELEYTQAILRGEI